MKTTKRIFAFTMAVMICVSYCMMHISATGREFYEYYGNNLHYFPGGNGSYAYVYCDIPDGLLSIEGWAFRDCSSLSGVELPNGVSAVKKGAFWGCSSLKSFALPCNVNMLDQGVLANCLQLEEVSLHDGVLSIGYGAFYNCSSLQSLTIPAAVVNVGDQAFRSCSSLKRLTVKCEAAPMCSGDITDADVYASTILYVPEGKVAEYGFACIWEKFGNIEEIA